jgi:hypothetical protein
MEIKISKSNRNVFDTKKARIHSSWIVQENRSSTSLVASQVKAVHLACGNTEITKQESIGIRVN